MCWVRLASVGYAVGIHIRFYFCNGAIRARTTPYDLRKKSEYADELVLCRSGPFCRRQASDRRAVENDKERGGQELNFAAPRWRLLRFRIPLCRFHQRGDQMPGRRHVGPLRHTWCRVGLARRRQRGLFFVILFAF